ncbi:MAG: hypothetical protein O2944_02980 [Proteobacteria bacterium]|nr:hypothetical protein [Pseudomonadota bacterium]
MELTKILKSGEIARLFPVISETGKERRASSILLSVISAVPPFANALLDQLGQRVGERTKIDTFTEVVFNHESEGGRQDRPDGLVHLRTGKREWTCIIESKIGNNTLQPDQIERYLRTARDNNINAILTISNEFAVVPTHHPLNIQRNLVRKIELYHLSWSAILTEAMLLHEQAGIKDSEQAFLLRELIRFFSHPSAGVSGFNSMPKAWSSAVSNIQAGGSVTKIDGVEIINAWHQEIRDLSLIMSRIISCRVGVKLSRVHVADPEKWAVDTLKDLCENNLLRAEFKIPNTASSVVAVADLNTRSIRISMTVDAPKDRARNSSRTNWLLRQLKDVKFDDVYVGAIWASRAAKVVLPLTELQVKPEKLEEGNKNSEIRAFEITMTSNSARRFAGNRTFIEELELLAPRFYELIGQHLETWKPNPPKPKHSVTEILEKYNPEKDSENINLPNAGNAHSELLEIPAFLNRATTPIS